ncbi:MAG: alkaline phosphatase family protein [Deltaproteobacteria bacterium]|nr:alkaline phosphatase family protein [Deltaproteobacteria bacterium]
MRIRLQPVVVLLAVAALLGATTWGRATRADVRDDHRVVVLGIDGLDPVLLQQFIDEGLLPNFAKLKKPGHFIPLGTSIPPQSPVSWSNFLTGMDPGGHGIFDFIALNRKTLIPYMSTARVEPPARDPLAVGRWRIPMDLTGAKTLQLRDGVAFFEVLEEHGVPTTMFRVPANYPPIETAGKAISGMGTPDLRGTSGTFTFVTNDPDVEKGRVSGGVIQRALVRDHRVVAKLEGPPNDFIEKSPRATAEIEIRIDPENPVAEIDTGLDRTLLNVGEWSGWLRTDFEMVPYLVGVQGMVRVYLQQVRPHFRLYVSPVNIDPREPAQPISTPEDYSVELSEAAGPFYTQEMPEDTKALSAHVLDPGEFLAQSGLVLEERRRLLRHELRRYLDEQKRGLLFFYFSSVDQRGHMLWRQMDGEHPFHDAEGPANLTEAMRTTYVEFDEIVGWARAELDDETTLIIMSDHGFSPFNRQANLNTWLEQNGYLTLKNPDKRDEAEWLTGIDWRNTRAFAIGLNSLYLNVRGRERNGSVARTDRLALAREIAAKLNEWVDPENGKPVVTQAVLREDVYHGPHVHNAPDLLVGYARGYRASWGTTSGKVPALLLEDNDREWSGDHCMDSRAVPGVLLSNKRIAASEADLRDMPVSILAEFAVDAPAQMKGKSVF